MRLPPNTPLTHTFQIPWHITKNQKQEKKENHEIPPIPLLLPPSKFLLHNIKGLINLISPNPEARGNSVGPFPVRVLSPSAIAIGIELEGICKGGFAKVSDGDGRAHVKPESRATWVGSAVHARCAEVLHRQGKSPGGGSGGGEGGEEEEVCWELHFRLARGEEFKLTYEEWFQLVLVCLDCWTLEFL